MAAVAGAGARSGRPDTVAQPAGAVPDRHGVAGTVRHFLGHGVRFTEPAGVAVGVARAVGLCGVPPARLPVEAAGGSFG